VVTHGEDIHWFEWDLSLVGLLKFYTLNCW